MSHTITIEGKDVEICDKDFEALKASLLKEDKIWRPREGDTYFTIDASSYEGYAEYVWNDENSGSDEVLLACGMVFRTESEIQAFLAYQTALTTIKNYIVEHNLEFSPDWGNRKQLKYQIYFDHVKGEFDIDGYSYVQVMHQLYFKSEKDAQQVIDNCSDELKIIFGIK